MVGTHTSSTLWVAIRARHRWLTERRDQLRAEVDAAMLHLYELDRFDAKHVLDSFFVLRKYDQRDHGGFRAKRLVLVTTP